MASVGPEPRRVRVLDATLRDGDQAAGFAFSVDDKLRIAQALAGCGVDVIEAGFPTSSRIEADSCARIADCLAEAPNAPSISFLCRPLPDEIRRTAEAFGKNARSVIHLSLPVSDGHIRAKFGGDRADVLARAVAASRVALDFASEVEIGAEDATRADRGFLAEYCDAVTSSGARVVNIADTVGRALPDEFADLISFLMRNVPAFRAGTAIVGVHCHDDLGLATANTIAAVGAGCAHVEVTSLGLGERAGNASIEEFAAILAVRGERLRAVSGLDALALGDLSRLVSSLCGLSIPPFKSVIGSNARAHASGIHQQGMSRDPTTYEILGIERFGGAPERAVLSRHSGKSGVDRALREWAALSVPEEDRVALIDAVKASPDDAGPTFGVTDFLFLLRARGLIDARLVRLIGVRSRLSLGCVEFNCRFETAGPGRSAFGDADRRTRGRRSGRGMTPLDAALDFASRALGAEFRSVTLSESAFASRGKTRYRVYAEFSGARFSGEKFAVERVGADRELLIVSAVLDAVNVERCRVASLSGLPPDNSY